MESSSTPLAEYFWIAGVESVSYHDPNSQPAPVVVPVESTIIEDGEPEDEWTNGDQSKTNARHSRQNSASRLSRVSLTDRFSIQTLDDTDGNTKSNRSSATIRANNPPDFSNGNNENSNGGSGQTPAPSGVLGEGSMLMGDFDFDKALVKFAAEREVFLEDLTFSAGAKVQARAPMVNPRMERIKAEESDSGRLSPLRSIKGSIRRKMSFRDMNSVRKQPSNRISTSRAASIRTTRRLSNYNSVIPPPEPLNTDPDMHPLKRRFEPVLLDRYPPQEAGDEISRRGRFPDYVPMFAFPNDIQIVSSDDRPRSTWHGFTMTSDDNSKLYGITIIIWTALNAEVAEEVEKKCEQWRQSHMSEEERELAASLGVRLAGERTHLSQLLAKLPTIPSGSPARERLEDEISTVEEKITLMTDMLRPLRHGAASKIEGLTAGESGLWVPRAYGILGRDAGNMSFWKEWLKAIVTPMTDGGILRIPPSSPRVGRWQPLERYVVNLCTEAFNPLGSKTQVELGVRELRLYARKEADNEIPGSRSIDLYALFRCLSLENIVALFEYAMAESRIIFLSSHTSMLHLACHALANLLYPLKWSSIFIPVLPARLLSALEAPCPYIVGIERRYDNIELPEDDYVLVDLDKDTIDATSQPVRLPRQARRKLMSLLQVAAPHKLRYGVTTGPPPYAMESFPYDAFSTENGSLFRSATPKSTLGKWVSQSSSGFGEPDPPTEIQPPVFNAFASAHVENGKSDRPSTSKSGKTSPQSSVSPVSINFPPMPSTPVSRSDSGFALAATLREKRSGHFGEEKMRRSSSFGIDKHPPFQKPGMPFLNGHQANLSISAISVESQNSVVGGANGGNGGYAPSTYAQSTLAASTIMPSMQIQPYLGRPSKQQKSNGQLYAFDMDGFIKSLPHDQHDYAAMMRETQCFNEFIHDREMQPANNASIRLFDEIIMAKKARGRSGLATGLSRLSTIRASHGASTYGGFGPPRGGSNSKIPAFLGDMSDHIWRTASVPLPKGNFPGEYRTVVTRTPARLDRSLMREPRSIQGMPRVEPRGTRGLIRKQVPS
ncbi:hypothetical protein ACLX1H_009817 [Fusarium chlamydosporum]